MWEYIGKKIRKYRTEIAIAGCSIALSFFVGCTAFAEGLAEGGKELRDYKDTPTGDIHHHHSSDGFDDGYWRMEYEKEKLRRLEQQQRLESRAIREHTRKMLRKSAKLREK